MDENKIVKLNIEQSNSLCKESESFCESKEKKNKHSNSLHSNPILKKILFNSLVEKNNKFTLKDLFK